MAYAIEDKAHEQFIGACGMTILNPEEIAVFLLLLDNIGERDLLPKSCLLRKILLVKFIPKIRAFITLGNLASRKVAEKTIIKMLV